MPQMVIAVPEVRHLRLEEGDEFLILACDGIWDVLSNQEVHLPLEYSTGSEGFLTSCPTPHWLPSFQQGIPQRGLLFQQDESRLCKVVLCCTGGGVCAQAPGAAHDAAGHLRGHV